MIIIEAAFFDLRQQAHGPDGMLVHGVMVVHVELHLGDHAAEIGNESTENRSFVHPAKHSFGIAGRRQHLHEESVGPLIITDVRSEEHTSELQSLMRISYAVFCLKKKKPQYIQRSCKNVKK